jgi:hypothetical protein
MRESHGTVPWFPHLVSGSSGYKERVPKSRTRLLGRVFMTGLDYGYSKHEYIPQGVRKEAQALELGRATHGAVLSRSSTSNYQAACPPSRVPGAIQAPPVTGY